MHCKAISFSTIHVGGYKPAIYKFLLAKTILWLECPHIMHVFSCFEIQEPCMLFNIISILVKIHGWIFLRYTCPKLLSTWVISALKCIYTKNSLFYFWKFLNTLVCNAFYNAQIFESLKHFFYFCHSVMNFGEENNFYHEVDHFLVLIFINSKA